MAPKIISIYTEVSPTGAPFKSRPSYSVYWPDVISASVECGLIEVIERSFDGMISRITLWSDHNSYERWLGHPRISDYLSQRDQYNAQHGIISQLTIVNLDNAI